MRALLLVFVLAFAQHVFAFDWKIVERREGYVRYKNMHPDTHSGTLVLNKIKPGTVKAILFSHGQPVLSTIFTPTDFPTLESLNGLLTAFRKSEPTIPDFRQEFFNLIMEADA